MITHLLTTFAEHEHRRSTNRWFGNLEHSHKANNQMSSEHGHRRTPTDVLATRTPAQGETNECRVLKSGTVYIMKTLAFCLNKQ